ncbi:MAG: hypothetical protein RMK91_06385 [Pseudanabaenaceae cyanobacterium SKYGB_i_bin29]|nr:hypothetical protein [Pseudanabaenaceae cyanobacterium SKYG29]MDW8421479.1 hypothetical protein [Pseudanabaenaceae cyanobacterium SKYGB_i_bin29]
MGITRSLVLLSVILVASNAGAETVVPQDPMQPSPWWVIDRFGQNLVIDTTIDPAQKRIILTVDTGVWSNLDYLGRYSVLHHLSSSVIPYNYSLVVQTKRQVTLATYAKQGDNWDILPPGIGALPLRPRR